MGFSAYPKVFNLGIDYIANIFDDEVDLTEKIDGSMVCLGRIEGEVRIRSKGREIFQGATDKLFQPAVDFAFSTNLPDNIIFYGETLAKPKHNTLAYSRVPTNNIVIFGACTLGNTFISDYDELAELAASIGLETVPLLFRGKVESVAQLQALLDTESYLGGTKIEGVVVKNYAQPFLIGGHSIPVMCGKHVSEAFKETHNKNWASQSTTRGKWEVFAEQFRSEARWDKAIQHLRDNGTLENSPRDIGPLIKEVQRDITEEEIDGIKTFLWKEFGGDLLRKSVAGLPEAYKAKLMESVLPATKEET